MAVNQHSSGCAPVRADEVTENTEAPALDPGTAAAVHLPAAPAEDSALAAAVEVVGETPEHAAAFADGLGIAADQLSASRPAPINWPVRSGTVAELLDCLNDAEEVTPGIVAGGIFWTVEQQVEAKQRLKEQLEEIDDSDGVLSREVAVIENRVVRTLRIALRSQRPLAQAIARARSLPLALDVATIDRRLPQWTTGDENGWRQLNELTGIVGASKEAESAFKSYLEELAGAGWLPPASPDQEAQGNLRDDFKRAACEWIRVGYLGALDVLGTAFPDPMPASPKVPSLGHFSFNDDEVFLAEIPLDAFATGLEMAALEERHYNSLRSDYIPQIDASLEGIPKLREAQAELESELQESGDPRARACALSRYTTRIMRAAFEAGRKHDAARSDTPLDELVVLLNRNLAAFTDTQLTAGGYWSQADVDAARRIWRLEHNSEDWAPVYKLIDEGMDEDEAWDEVHPLPSEARTRTDRVVELADIFRKKIGMSEINRSALTEGGETGVPYWTQQEAAEAMRIVRAERGEGVIHDPF